MWPFSKCFVNFCFYLYVIYGLSCCTALHQLPYHLQLAMVECGATTHVSGMNISNHLCLSECCTVRPYGSLKLISPATTNRNLTSSISPFLSAAARPKCPVASENFIDPPLARKYASTEDKLFILEL
ncbi:hypothetical protein L211DRAFT_427122 [Terfezia boudieri ATCC MYA-4762]|uniref:Uncharacterized protein n=1 Tax=Terfezia boudieri ATCC MYA-4762 TaxID=1051890 RepID=A0A3N4LJL8_9PEZI|nr:hypothetical protein L211DRAFT_427122 [Terfezia boudieri ATCC MYA-4762]